MTAAAESVQLSSRRSEPADTRIAACRSATDGEPWQDATEPHEPTADVRTDGDRPDDLCRVVPDQPPGLQVEPGCYDAELQLYVSSKTGRPAYVGLSASERTQLADTTGSRCSISTMTGQRSSPDDHSDSVQDDFD